MKKLLSLLLVLGMILTLAPMALASEEAVADEPEEITEEPVIEEETIDEPVTEEEVTEEPAEEVTEEPAEAEEPVDEPADVPEPEAEASLAEDTDTCEADAEPAPEESEPSEIAPAADGRSGNGKALQLTAADIDGQQRSYVFFGNYWQSGTEKEPVKWRVLENDGNRLFLLSDQNLDVYWYHKTYTSITWADSDIRSWLNGTAAGSFAGDAFSAAELSAIPQTDVVNDVNPEYGTEGGPNTKDQVFLLSIAEATNTAYGFDKDDDSSTSRQSRNTAYVANGGKTGVTGMSAAGKANWWWLRSPGYYDYIAALVYTSVYCQQEKPSNFKKNRSIYGIIGARESQEIRQKPCIGGQPNVQAPFIADVPV